MELFGELQDLSNRIEGYSNLNEAETETFCFEPFIRLLGFDPTNPEDVRKQYSADIRGGARKVDYAIKKEDVPIMIVECKPLGDDLDAHYGQLKEYFTAVGGETRFGILTDGRLYRFYTDLEAPNLMDENPFLEFDLINIEQSLVAGLEQFTKSRFDLDEALAAVRNLKDSEAIQQFFMEQSKSPTEDFVNHVADTRRFTINDNWTGKQTKGFRYKGETYWVEDASEFLTWFCEILSKDNTIQFEDVLGLNPRFFSKTPDTDFPSIAISKLIGSTGIYVRIPFSNKDKQKMVDDLADHFGCALPEIQYE